MISKGLPRCPEDCGGPDADPSALTPAQRSYRRLWGCDAPAEPRWGMTCTLCDGVGATPDGGRCPVCTSPGRRTVGIEAVDRCPSALIDRSAARAFRCWQDLRQHGTWPVPGGLLDQAADFVRFTRELEAEIDAARRAEQADRT